MTPMKKLADFYPGDLNQTLVGICQTARFARAKADVLHDNVRALPTSIVVQTTGNLLHLLLVVREPHPSDHPLHVLSPTIGPRPIHVALSRLYLGKDEQGLPGPGYDLVYNKFGVIDHFPGIDALPAIGKSHRDEVGLGSRYPRPTLTRHRGLGRIEVNDEPRDRQESVHP